jgi:DNA-binding transcriptional ArsR family regulator
MHMHAGLENFAMPSEEAVQRAAAWLRLLGDPTRIKVLCALLQGESSVTCLAELVSATPTAVSQHLAKLRLAGLVQPRRDGAFVYYVATNDSVRRLLTEVLGPLPADNLAAPLRS